jgi:hypothetical protein
VEELYFFRRYAEAVKFIQLVFSEQGGSEGLDLDTKTLLRHYLERCEKRAQEQEMLVLKE